MKDINEIMDSLINSVIENKLDYLNTTIHEKFEIYDVIIEVRIEKERLNPYGVINTIPQPNFDDILPEEDRRK